MDERERKRKIERARENQKDFFKEEITRNKK